MFYVNDEPEGIFLYTETIKLYCIVLYEAGSIILIFEVYRPELWS